MLAPLATLAFLTALWLVAVVTADLLGLSLGKVTAALRGNSLLSSAQTLRPIAARVSQRVRPAQPLRARSRLRAAA